MSADANTHHTHNFTSGPHLCPGIACSTAAPHPLYRCAFCPRAECSIERSLITGTSLIIGARVNSAPGSPNGIFFQASKRQCVPESYVQPTDYIRWGPSGRSCRLCSRDARVCCRLCGSRLCLACQLGMCVRAAKEEIKVERHPGVLKRREMKAAGMGIGKN